MRLRCEVADGVYLVLAKALLHVRGGGDVAVFESKVGTTVQYAGVVEGCAVVQLVEGYDVVLWVC
jgi:hypothetical protein